jgi:Ulp1 family protease
MFGTLTISFPGHYRSKNDLITQLNVLLQTPNKEAERVAADLLRPLTAEEREVINNAVYGVGPAGEVLAAIKGTNISVQHQSMHRLQPGEWLNDETINFYFTMICQHDSEFYYADPNQKRNYFSTLHFMDKLLNLGHPSKEGEYEYINVKKWLEAVPGGDVFELDKIFFLINIGRMHWICAVISMMEKKIYTYNSKHNDGKEYLESLFQYVQDKYEDKNGVPLPEIDEWELVGHQLGTPYQTNGM